MKDDQYSKKETDARFQALLKGAMHKPTPLKDIPKTRAPKSKSPKTRKATS